MLRNASRGKEPKGQALLRMPFRGAAGPHFRAWCSHGKVIKSYWEIEHRIVHLGLEKERIFLETVPTHDVLFLESLACVRRFSHSANNP